MILGLALGCLEVDGTPAAEHRIHTATYLMVLLLVTRSDQVKEKPITGKDHKEYHRRHNNHPHDPVLLLGFEDDEEGAGFADDSEENGLAGFNFL